MPHKKLSAVVGLALALFLQSGAPAAVGFDADKSGSEAVEFLSQYLKIDTTNPPGNEKLGAEFLANILKNNGIEAKLFDTDKDKNRACVYARLKGNGKKKAIILLNHIDVVPAKAEDWQTPPFSGQIANGEIWGRGALDMKNMGIAELETMLMLKRSGKQLDRDVIFLGTPDEELSGRFGAEWFAKNHPELVKDAEFLINEGFFIEAGNDGKARYWGVDVSEKSVLWLKILAKGEAGHASMPMEDSATNRLTKGLSRLLASPPLPTVLPAVREYFKSIARIESPPLSTAYQDIDAAVKKKDSMELIGKDKLRASMLRNTVSLTVMKAGYKTNVIPAEAYAEIDCRLLPNVDSQTFIAEIKKTLNDPSLEVSVLDWVKADASAYDTECFNVIKQVAAQENPGVPVVPMVVPWFTDSHWFRDLGVVSYGFEPFRLDPKHLASVHGKDERIPVDVFKEGVQLLYKIVEKLVVSP